MYATSRMWVTSNTMPTKVRHKIAKKARLEALEPMEVAQYYTNRFNGAMAQSTYCLPASNRTLRDTSSNRNSWYSRSWTTDLRTNRTVLFTLMWLNTTKMHRYGILSGRNLEDVHDASRELDGVGEKRHQVDFALWKRHNPSTSCVGPHPGVKASRAGTANARRWDVNTWVKSLTSTAVVWTSYSPTTSVKSLRQWLHSVAKW